MPTNPDAAKRRVPSRLAGDPPGRVHVASIFELQSTGSGPSDPTLGLSRGGVAPPDQLIMNLASYRSIAT
ncbi:hypothetical protein AB1L88_07205 [Tautonia sp. JC769]|uniref:hypothetical protein n=1 Tax=Tautonia sp. JC769 TaxID=3232135 RepID=UPI00345B0C91